MNTVQSEFQRDINNDVKKWYICYKLLFMGKAQWKVQATLNNNIVTIYKKNIIEIEE